jgi:dihydrofolate reductase
MIRIIWAAASGVVGDRGRLPWRLPEDLIHFSYRTRGFPVVMGARTWDSLPHGALPGRTNVVLSNHRDDFPGGVRAGSVDEVLDRWPDCWVIGGRTVWDQFLPRADLVERTSILLDVEGDTYEPTLDATVWRMTNNPPWHTGKDGTRYRFEQWEPPGRPRRLWAPWPGELVGALNIAQNDGSMHPYTCPHRDVPGHLETTDLGVLVATRFGWICPTCPYRQDWILR